MTRHLVNVGRWRINAYDNDVAALDLRIIDMRDRVKAALDPGGTGLQWKVSDVVKWTGSVSYSFYCFVIQHRDGAGIPTGKEWIIMPPGFHTNGTTKSTMLTNFGLGVDATINAYFIKDVGAYGNHTWAMHYNDKYTPDIDLQASAFTGTPVASEAVQVQGDPSRAGTLKTIVGTNNWIITQNSGAKFKPADIIEAPGSGATFTVSAINTDGFYDMGFDDFDAMTLSGGDNSAPGSNPDSALPTFMPSVDMLKGYTFVETFSTEASSGTYPVWSVLVFDDTKPFMAWYIATQDNHVITFYIAGDILETHKGAGVDDEKSATMAQSLRTDNNESGAALRTYINARYGDFSIGDAATGFAYFVTTSFNSGNTPDRRPIPQRPYSLVAVSNTNEYKGIFDRDVIIQTGAYNYDYLVLVGNGGEPFIKINQHMAYPWVDGELAFPPVRWHEEPRPDLLSEV